MTHTRQVDDDIVPVRLVERLARVDALLTEDEGKVATRDGEGEEEGPATRDKNECQ